MHHKKAMHHMAKAMEHMHKHHEKMEHGLHHQKAHKTTAHDRAVDRKNLRHARAKKHHGK
jgi:hypothetical protein